MRQIVDSALVPASHRPRLDRAIARAARWRDSVVAEAGVLLLAIALVTAGLRVELPAEISTWFAVATPAGPRLTAAGWWYIVVALPIFQFQVGRWLWRLVIWTVFLWGLSRLGLALIPTHPDLAGGLGSLGVVQTHFATLSFASSCVLAASFAENLLFAGVESIKWPTLGIALLNVLVFLGPLLLFTPQRLAVKREGLRDYGALAARYVRAFDAKWLRGAPPADEPLLGTADVQSLADLVSR